MYETDADYPNFTILSTYIAELRVYRFFAGTTFFLDYHVFNFGLSGSFKAL